MAGKVVSNALVEPGRGLHCTLQTEETFAPAASHQPSMREKPFLTPWTGNQMDSDHDVPQDEQRWMALPPPLGLLPLISH